MTSSADTSSQPLSMLAALSSRPFLSTPGSPQPVGVSSGTSTSLLIVSRTLPSISTTAVGTDGWGVLTRTRWLASSPVARFTRAP